MGARLKDRDGNVRKEFQPTFDSTFWELYLFAVMKHFHLEVNFSFNAPDFVITNHGGINVEATGQVELGPRTDGRTRTRRLAREPAQTLEVCWRPVECNSQHIQPPPGISRDVEVQPHAVGNDYLRVKQKGAGKEGRTAVALTPPVQTIILARMTRSYDRFNGPAKTFLSRSARRGSLRAVGR